MRLISSSSPCADAYSYFLAIKRQPRDESKNTLTLPLAAVARFYNLPITLVRRPRRPTRARASPGCARCHLDLCARVHALVATQSNAEDVRCLTIERTEEAAGGKNFRCHWRNVTATAVLTQTRSPSTTTRAQTCVQLNLPSLRRDTSRKPN